jgi:hypothetical protein
LRGATITGVVDMISATLGILASLNARLEQGQYPLQY